MIVRIVAFSLVLTLASPMVADGDSDASRSLAEVVQLVQLVEKEPALDNCHLLLR